MKSKAYIIRDILSDVYISLKNKADSMNNELVKEFDLKKVKPYDLLNFLKENDIPKDATFGIEYDCDYSCPCVKYCVLKPYSDAQKKEYIKSNFKHEFEDAMDKHKYKFYFNAKSDIFEEVFFGVYTDLYNLYVHGNIDKLVEYFCSCYKKAY